MTRYITIPEAIELVVNDVSAYSKRSSEGYTSEGYELRVIPEEIDLELALVFSDDRPLVSLVEDERDGDSRGAATSSHRLRIKFRPLVQDGRELKISTGEIVGSWRK